MAVLVQIISTIFPISKQKFFFEGGIRLRKFFFIEINFSLCFNLSSFQFSSNFVMAAKGHHKHLTALLVKNKNTYKMVA